MSATLQRHAIGLTWPEAGMMVRSAHALHNEGRVWLVDPFDDGPALREAESLGAPSGVFQLLDRHNRDCEAIAPGLGGAGRSGPPPPFAPGPGPGVHPMLRLPPPRSQLAPYRASMLLVGHGATIESDAATALDDALAHARSDIPRLITSLPKLVRGG